MPLSLLSKYIVIIDDDEDDRFVFREALMSTNLEAIFKEYGSGEDFLYHMDNEAKIAPDVIFLDINMPKSDGYKTLKAIRENEKLSDTSVIMFTTSSGEFDVERAQENFASGFATKPVEYNDLKNVIVNVINHFHDKTSKKSFFVNI